MSEVAPISPGEFHDIDRSGGRYSRESFGHQTEGFVAESLADISSIEIIEMASEEEDTKKGIDFWIKFRGWDAPVGVQFTGSEDPQRMKEKIERFPQRVTKEDTPISKIKGEGKTCWVILARGPLAEFGRHYDAYIAMRKDQKDPRPSQIIPEHLIADIYRQILKGYSQALGNDQPRLREEFLATVARHSAAIH